MRISTSQIYQRGTVNMLQQQEKALKLYEQLSSGLRVKIPSDDPIASTQIELMNQRISSTELLQKNREAAESTLTLEESIISGSVSSLQRLHEIQVQAGNSALSEADRKALAVEAKTILNQLYDYANSKDNNNSYMFSGSQSTIPAVSVNAAGQYVYNGDSMQRYQAVSGNLQIAISDTGDDVFMRIANGNGRFAVSTPAPNAGTAVLTTGAVTNSAAYVADEYTINFALNTAGEMVVMVTGVASGDVIPASGLVDDAPLYQEGAAINFSGMEITIEGRPVAGDAFSVKPAKNESVFSTVQRMINNLNQPFGTAVEKAATQTENNQLLAQLESSLNHMLSYQSDLGARLNQLDSADTLNSNMLTISQSTLKQLREIDPTKVATEYNLQLVNLQAAQQGFVRIQSLSVFNYL
ncbi:MAG: flagellar hook-associated protein FlgL [Legionella sp.]